MADVDDAAGEGDAGGAVVVLEGADLGADVGERLGGERLGLAEGSR